MKDRAYSLFCAVIEEYARLEPDGADSWNPIDSDREMLHRLALYEQLCRAIAASGLDRTQARVLDVGCGNGRSTRVYLDFGFGPDQLTGVDLRRAAVEMARSSHPDINYLTCDGSTLPVEEESIDWVSVCTVMSSIPGPEARDHLARQIVRVLASGGYVFYWDRARAKRFAGGDRLEPASLFPSLTVVSEEWIRLEGCIDRYFPGRVLGRTLLPIARRLATPRTHRVCLLEKPAAPR